jgi:WD40 repeat protein
VETYARNKSNIQHAAGFQQLSTRVTTASRKKVLFDFKLSGVFARLKADPHEPNSIINLFSFAGHSGSITCMMVPKNTNHLMTGSEDTSVIVWDIKTQAVKTRLW